MKKTNKENLLAGLTNEAQAGAKSQPVMKDGEEPQDMLLALLNSPLKSLLDSQQGKILGTCLNSHGRSTILILYGVEPTANNTLKPVGSVACDTGKES